MPNYDSPNMSDATILCTVEDLINRALGPPDANIVNFKIVQSILHILARQQRMLQQKVEITVEDLKIDRPREKKGRETSTETSSAKSPSPRKSRMSGITEEQIKLKRDSSKTRKGKDAIQEADKKDKAKVDKEQKAKEQVEQKEKEKASKVDQKAEKAAQKEKAEKAEKREKENAEKAAQKEIEKTEKEERKEKERAERAAQKEMEKEESKEKERAERERMREGKQQLKAIEGKKSKGGPEISEKQTGNENVLVVEKGPTTRTEPRPRGSIEIVTQSQFALLEAAVKELKSVAAPQPLQLPANEKLKSDLAKGTASLPEAMQTLQVDARVKAAESAIHRMAGLLTQLAAAGALPDSVAEQLEHIGEPGEKPERTEEAKSRVSVAPKRSVAIDLKPSQVQHHQEEALKPHPSMATPSIATPSVTAPSVPVTPRPSTVTSAGRHSMVSKPSRISTSKPSDVSRPSSLTIPGVTYEEMNAALKELRNDISKDLTNMTIRATTAADNALHTAKTIADRLDVALKLDSRISHLYSLVGDYAEQLNGFDTGLTTQMQSFKDQMAEMRTDLRAGMAQLENVNNNAETAAVMELTERYEELSTELEITLHAHKSLTGLQTQLSTEMHSLVECMEMLREQKADRDEVLDGLRDKADSSRLAGLLSEADFAGARADFERRIDLCHEKFKRQELVWTAAIRDLIHTTDKKAEIVELLSAREDAQQQLQELHDKTRILAAVLGEPKAALLMRKLAVGAVCGSCQAAALMEPCDAATGTPARLPALRPPPVGAPAEPCLADWVGPEPPDTRHVCHRWCGGSHTLLTDSTKRGRATAVQLQSVPTRRYADYGSDGRLYMVEEGLQPCLECNKMGEEEGVAPEHGAGDRQHQPDSPASPDSPMVCSCPLLK